MQSTYSVSEAQAQLPALLKKAEADGIPIAKRDKIAVVFAQRIRELLE
jgi:hypothetical protein